MKLSSFKISQLAGALVVGIGFFSAGVAAADEEPDCSDQLQQIPRDGAQIEVANPWLTYSGNVVYGGISEATSADAEVSGSADVGSVELDAESYRGVRLEEAAAGSYDWHIGEGQSASFVIDESASIDEEPPTMGEGDVEASLELMVYEEFPVMFRHWTVRFPAGSDEHTTPENMRYLVEFQWEDGGEQESAQILVTPHTDQAGGEEIEVELGGRTDLCHHSEPTLPVTVEAKLSVWAIDLAGNRSEAAATGEFAGVPAEKLAAAHDEFHEVIATLGDDGDGTTMEEAAEELEAEGAQDDEEASSRCTAVGGQSTGWIVVLAFIGVAMMRRKPVLCGSV